MDGPMGFNARVQNMANQIFPQQPPPPPPHVVRQVSDRDPNEIQIFRSTMLDDKPDLYPSKIIRTPRPGPTKKNNTQRDTERALKILTGKSVNYEQNSENFK